MSALPSIPPRPTRSTGPTAQLEAPKVPPRPNRTGRSVSPDPNRDTFARSPLNHPYQNGPPPKPREVPSRPPSTSLPGLGEEGNEYASYEDLSKTLTDEGADPEQITNVAGDLPLHAPTASVPASTAKSRIQTVTRTDSSQAEAAGFGKQLVPEDKTAKSARSGSSLGSRPSSIYNEKDEHGIPEIGVQVPMFRHAGDVQAPSPAPFAQPGSGGVAFQKPGGRHHGRTKSGREIFHGPPGSYGMHGHGKISQDEFEKKWYEKHPEDLKREKAGEYGPHIQENRKDYHWRADNLEQLIHSAGAQGTGLGTSREAMGTPDEQIGYIATDQYASRYASPRPQSSGRPTSIKGGIQTDSPLRQETQTTGDEQLDDNGEVFHIDPPSHRTNKVHGGGYDPPTLDLGAEGGNTTDEGGWVTERGYGVPILASDELKKHPEAEWRQPAVSPEMERRGDDYIANEDTSYVTKARSPSRSSSRNNSNRRSIPSPAQFDRGGTPLESHKEYEPLFPEDDEGKKPKSQVEKLKRPTAARHQFPSQDVWEDTPGSLQLQTTVETPEVPDEAKALAEDVNSAEAYEKPETEEARKDDITAEDQQSFLTEHTKRFAADNKLLGKVRDEQPLRPGVQRFPSQDIWEDAPDHGQHTTTVSTPQVEDANEYAEDSPAVEKPGVPARPSIPARPQKTEASPVDKKAPIIPDRPKPQIPVRPGKPVTTARGEDVGSVSPVGENDAPQPKAKPPVPARPAGSKIAALQAGFMKDLNSKLGLGPQAPKVKEPEPEVEPEPAAPLQDARKGRAKGPQRRKPAASPAPAATVTAEVAVPRQRLEIGPVTEVWRFDASGALDVPAATLTAKLQSKLQIPSQSRESGSTADEDEAELEGPTLTKTTTQGSGSAELARSTTKDAELPELSQPLSKNSPTSELSQTISKGSDLVSPDEPLVAETITGSVDAPGAFPGMEETDESAPLGGSLKEQSSLEKPGEETTGVGDVSVEVKPKVQDDLQK
ncbi:altered inheritance of mitochondria protein 21 [Phaeosphaeriaceae sp. PMI808]|nr:altered inheritance of mitochondria protein 21 [Phaeosphaeriaceae sp. PMI808]